MKPALEPTPRRRQHLALAAVLLLTGAGLYANSLHNSFVYDDIYSILESPNVCKLWPLSESMTGPPGSGSNGRPLVALSLAINYALGGVDVRGYHVFNICVHVLCALVLFSLARGTLALPVWSESVRGGATWLGFGLALVWLVHPLHTAALNHIVYRNETMAALFYLLTLDCLRHSATVAPAASTHSRRQWVWWVLAMTACLFAMASKEIAVSCPVVALLYDRAFLSGSFRSAWRQRRSLYMGLAATWLPLAWWVVSADRGASVGIENQDVTPFQYARTQFGVLAHYVRLAFWPQPLVLDYKWPIAPRLAQVAPQAFLVAGMLAATAWALVRAPRWGFLGAFFFAVLAPTSSFIPLLGAVAAEHRMVLPLVPLLATVLALIRRLLAMAGLRSLRPLAVLLVLASVALGWRTVMRNRDFRTHEGIWLDTLAKRPENPTAHNNLGTILADQGRLPEAAAHFREAWRLAPLDPTARDNLGSVLLRMGDQDGAIQHFAEAIRLDPKYAKPRSNLASLLTRRHQYDKAKRLLDAAIRLAPDYGMAHYNLGHVFLATGQTDSAVVAFENAAARLPHFAEAHHNLAVIFLRRHDYARAAAHLRATLDIDPRHAGALNNMAWLLATCPDDAIRDGKAAVALSEQAITAQGAPTASLLDTQAAALAETGNFERAVAVATEAITAAGSDSVLAARLRARLALYRVSQPFRMDTP